MYIKENLLIFPFVHSSKICRSIKVFHSLKPTNEITVSECWTVSRGKPPLWTMIEIFNLRVGSENLFELLLILAFPYKQFNIFVANNNLAVHCVCSGFGHELKTQSDERKDWFIDTLNTYKSYVCIEREKCFSNEYL